MECHLEQSFFQDICMDFPFYYNKLLRLVSFFTFDFSYRILHIYVGSGMHELLSSNYLSYKPLCNLRLYFVLLVIKVYKDQIAFFSLLLERVSLVLMLMK